MLRSSLVLVFCLAVMSLCAADEKPAKKTMDANSLAYLDECHPWYPHKDFPKLTTPQWVGEEGVEAVIVLAIDDMRDPAKYEQYLRPILNRLKQIDGRAPVSIMTCDVKPDDAQLQSWLGEGLSIECHTIDHPCPILQGGDFAKAKSTYDRCVDLMGTIPGNKPVAFRTPCCDSLNTVSPRFFSEIFSSTTEKGNFLQIDSSVFTFFTSEDESLPKELVLDANGKERFWKYLPKNNKYGGNTHDNFVNYIKNYPYPYVINNSCWEIPCIAPSDWSAQHLHGINNPVTIEDWKAAIDLTVHKQGCFSLVFHPHGWIKPEQVVEMIDHAVAKHGNKVKFLNFREVAERLEKAESGKLKAVWTGMTNFQLSPSNETVESAESIFGKDPNITGWLSGFWPVTPYGLRPIRRDDGTHNGFFIHDNHFCWINEDTAKLPDLMYRVSFEEALAAAQKNGDSAAEQRQQIAPGASPGNKAPNDQKAPEGRHNSDGGDGSAAPSGLENSSSTETPGSRPGLSAAVAPRLNRVYSPVPIGAAVVDITPDYPVRLTGYGNRMKESDGVAAKIHARALVIGESASGGREPSGPSDGQTTENASYRGADAAPLACLITVDNCGVPLEMTEAVYERIAAKYNIPRQNFAISSTHSHSAPWLRGFAPNIFAEIPDDHAAHLAQYEKELTDKLVDVVDKAIASQRPGHLSYGFGEAGFAMNRRALANGKWSGFGEVPDGPTDKRVPVLAAHDVDGKLIAVLANYACHCTTETGDFNQISGDWAGFAADMLEADHPGAVALIAIGCGADANPSPRGTHEQAKGHGRTIADEVTRILANVAVSLRRDEPLPALQDSGTPVASAKDSATDNAASADNANTARLISAERDGYIKRINPDILCNMARIDLPLGPIPSRETWEQQAKEPGVTGSRARYFLQMLDEGKPIPTTIPNYPVQTWCFGDDLAMVFLGGEVVVDYSIRMNDMFDSDRLWINAYSNDVPCYIASARVLREGGYECDSSMLFYRRPTRLAPEAEDVLCDAVQKIMPHKFYSEKLQQDFPAPKSPEESLKTMTTKPDLRVVLAASEPLIRDPVAFDWDERGRLWVVEMGDYPKGDSSASGGRQPSGTAIGPPNSDADVASGIHTRGLTPSARQHRGRVQMLEDTDKNGVYDKATTFLDNLAFPTGIHCWRGGVIITMAPEIFYAEDTDGDGKADVRETMYRGFVEGNQQHRINGLRWGLDGWLYLANGDSGGEIAGTGYVPGEPSVEQASGGRQPAGTTNGLIDETTGRLTPAARQIVNLRGRDLRINPDTNELDALSGQTQFGRERDDFGNWFGNNNSNPIWQYVLEDRYVRRNPHAGISQVTAPVAVVPGAAPVYPTSRTLARFNDFAFANRFTSACSTMIYRDNYLGEQYYGNAFTSEPVHNLVSRLVMTRDGYGFKGERAADEQQSEFLASSDNWFRPTMIRTGPDGAIWVADMYRAVIEHPEWIPPEYQRKMNLYAGGDMGRIYRIVPASECCGDSASGAASAPRENGTDVPQQPNPLGGLTPSARQGNDAHGELTPNRSPERDGYFDQPWNEIPLVQLRQRIQSSNGWWRDTAHRILLHRIHELDSRDITAVVQAATGDANEAVSVQAGALLSSVSEHPGTAQALASRAEAIPALLTDVRPTSRRMGLQMVESSEAERPANDLVMSTLEGMTSDEDRSVRLQLALTAGRITHQKTSIIIARLLQRDFDDAVIRNAAISSLTPGNIKDVLTATLNLAPENPNEQLIGLLLGQAAAMEQQDAITGPLMALISSLKSDATSARIDSLASTVSSVLNGDIAKRLQSNRTSVDVINAAGSVAQEIALDETADVDRRAAAIRFAGVSDLLTGRQSLDLIQFLTPQTPFALQLSAVQLMGRDFNQEVVDQVVRKWSSLDPAVRADVMTNMLRRENSIGYLLDRIEAGSLSAGDLDASQRDRLINHGTAKISERARKVLGEVMANSARSAVVDDFKSQISNLKFEISKDEQAAAGKLVLKNDVRRVIDCRTSARKSEPIWQR
jgi:putative membrane-bound dehydrogenase-like protein